MVKIIVSALAVLAMLGTGAACLATLPKSRNGKKTTNTADLPLLSGVYKMGHGFNALTGQSGGFPIIDWTFNGGQTWTSPSGTTYKVPDQTYLAPHSRSSTVTCQKISSSFSDIFSAYESSYSFSVGVGVPGVFGAAVNYSHELAETHELIKGNNMYYGFSTYYSNYYSLDMGPAYTLPLGFQLKQGLLPLPDTIATSSAEKLYNEFVTSFGTHYVTLADFGGKVHSMAFLNKSFSHSHSTEEIASQITASFHFDLYNISVHGGFNHHTNRSSIHIAKWFRENAKTHNYWEGGNIAYQHNTTQTKWLNSVPDMAGMVNATLMPIDRLVTDDAQKQKTLSAFCKEYIEKQGSTAGFRYP